MKRKINLLIALILITGHFFKANAQGNFFKISNYQVYFGWAHNFPQDYMIVRKFEDDGKNYFMLVNPLTLETRIDETGPYQVKPMTLAEAILYFKNTAYIKAINAAQKQSKNIQDAGIETGMPKETGISLTADLCPSHKPLDRLIFTDIVTEFQKVEKPVPVALSVSGIWMRDHVQDLNWLKTLEQEGEIHVTWINHSYNHRVSATLPLKENFLLEPGTDISYEVLETEKAMLKNGLLPSVFFRFPGLVSDQQLVFKITDFGLIPIGSDAWLAKGQKPEAGSIVLIHGNGNEPIGVKDFVKLLQDKAPQIAKKQWLLYDLRASVDQEFDE
jgi:hypothetical protein